MTCNFKASLDAGADSNATLQVDIIEYTSLN